MKSNQKQHIEGEYTEKQKIRENQTSWRFSKKLQRLWASRDYWRKVMKKMDTGEHKIPIEDAVAILSAVWIDLRRALTPPYLSHAAWVLRCFLEIETATVPHHSVKVWVCRSYAIKKGISEEQARLDFIDGVERVSRAARRVFFNQRDTAVADLHESLLLIKHLREGEMDSEFATDSDIGFIDNYIGELHTLIIHRR